MGVAGRATSTDELPLAMTLKIIEIPLEEQRFFIAAVKCS